MNPTVVGPPESRDSRVQSRLMSAPPMFSTDLVGTSLPVRGLLHSVLVHGLFVMVFLYAPWSYWFPTEPHLEMAQSVIQEREDVLILPDLQPMGGAAPAAPAPADSGRGAKQQSAGRSGSSAARKVQGVAYKGPQLIVSDPPHPDNVIQTVRQPDLPVKPKLPHPLQMPSMVSIAPSKPILAPPAPKPAPEVAHENLQVKAAAAEPISLPPETPRVEAPKLPLPVASTADAPLRTVANVAAPASMPKLAHQNQPAKGGTDAQSILVVNAIPVSDRKPSAIPPGELNGAFTVSPVPLTARSGATGIGLPGGGLDVNGVPGTGNGSGAGGGSGAGAGNGSSTGTGAGTGDKSAGGTGDGRGVRAGVGSGTGTGPGVPGGKGTGRGTGSGGRGSGSGSGPGTGSGNSPFPSIMIQGGSGSGGGSSARAPVADSPTRGSYGITIVASGASGGGFKDFGVFHDEASYTVYLDMSDAGVYGSNWTLQYALDSRRTSDSRSASASTRLVGPSVRHRETTSALCPRSRDEKPRDHGCGLRRHQLGREV